MGRDHRLALRALLTLLAGLSVAGIFAALSALLQDQLDLLPSGFNIDARAWRSTPGDGRALAVLSLNVLFLVIGAAGTLLLQRRRRLRHGAPF